MDLSRNIIKRYVQVASPEKITSNSETVYGTVVNEGETLYVKIDGSNILTPVSSTIDIKADDRVLVLVKNHEATVIGSPSSPTARLEELNNLGTEVTKFKAVATSDLIAARADIDNLNANKLSVKDAELKYATIEKLDAENATINGKLTAYEASIEGLKADKIDASEVEAKYATIESLDAANANITNLKATKIDATTVETTYATIENLEATNAKFTNLNAQYADIDFANIGEASIRNLFTKSGMIEHLTIKEANTTGALVAVTIKGDLIDANTLKADTLILRGDDGLYHKINLVAGTFTETEVIPDDKIHGSVIAANSITANQIYVTDLSAFGAKIGGFVIDDDSIHSDLKDSVNNLSQGIFLNSDGLMSVGDESNYIKFYEDETDESKKYKLEISADSIKFNVGNDSKTMSDLVESEQQLSNKIDVVQEKTNYIYVGTDINGKPYIELGDRNSRFKLKITNEEIQFAEDSEVPAYINNQKLMIEKAQVENELRFGGFVWKERSNGNMGLTWEGETS